MTAQPQISRTNRLDAIDIARGVALVAMVLYHFSWDLEFFGYLAPGTAGSGPLKWFARSIASSFLVLVGISLVLAHGSGIRRKPYFRRLATVAGAAAAITLATYLFTPDAFVFFGILHHIALASVIGLAFLGLPPLALVACAAIVLTVPHLFTSDLFAHPALQWVGLAPVPSRSNDYVPLFPWFAMVLTGMAAAGLASQSGLVTHLSRLDAGNRRPARALRFLGRNSLATYLLHQPLLIAGIYLFSLAFPAERSLVADNLAACRQTCLQQSGAEFCTAYCGCAISTLDEQGLLEPLSRGEVTPDSEPRITLITQDCVFRVENRND